MFAIESMALAKPVVVHLDEEAAAETEEAFGLELPLVRADEGSLEDVLAGLVERARGAAGARPPQPRLRRAGARAHRRRAARARDLRAGHAHQLVEARSATSEKPRTPGASVKLSPPSRPGSPAPPSCSFSTSSRSIRQRASSSSSRTASAHQRVVGGVAPPRDVEGAPARKESSMVVRVEDLRSSSRAGPGRARPARRPASRSTGRKRRA